jgi:chromosome segregation ATPase
VSDGERRLAVERFSRAGLEARLDRAHADVEALHASRLEAESQLTRVQDEFQAARLEISALQAIRKDLAEELGHERNERSERDATISRLRDELENERRLAILRTTEAGEIASSLRNSLESARRDRNEEHARLREATDEVVESRQRISALLAETAVLRVSIAQLQTKLSTHDQAREYVSGLETDVADKQRAIDEGTAYARQLERELEAIRKAAVSERSSMLSYVDEFKTRESSFQREIGELRQELDARGHHEVALNRQIDGLRVEVKDFKGKLADCTDKLANCETELAETSVALETTDRHLHETRAELETRISQASQALREQTAELSVLIETVQSSHFWRLKRWLNRLRGRTLGIFVS